MRPDPGLRVRGEGRFADGRARRGDHHESGAALLSAMARWTTPTGSFAAHFDPHSIRNSDGSSAARRVSAEFRRAGMDYDRRRHRVSARGRRTLSFPAVYPGADDTAGPGYTGQPAVASYYDWRPSE
ncbi:hypothetical protein [Nocardia sp. NBC_01377]|uniref:hypothetical protein n=1 Tax=Nocardia sp. NBC_01377 TaxID=2903595 RepID=UPI003866331B